MSFHLVVAGVILLLVLIVLAVVIVGIYNNLVRLKNNIDKSWANIDVLLKQRTDEIPNLVETVKGYMAHEREVLQNVTEARTAVMNAEGPAESAAADDLLTGALKSLFAVAEDYPELKANENFLQLQDRISGIENEIADRREFYNEAGRLYNTRIESFPDMLVARQFGFDEPVELYRAEEADREPVQVEF